MALNKKWITIAFSLLIISAAYGWLIRYNNIYPLDFINYKNFLQSHSHVAFLGWGYLAIINCLNYLFLEEKKRNKKIYKILFYILLTSILGMLFSFPMQGYKGFSIVLLSVFGITSYVYSFQFLKDLKGSKNNGIEEKYIRYSIYYYLLSSLATWFLVYVILAVGKTSLYYNTIYFYLHFLYNGFIVLALFGIFFKVLKKMNIPILEYNKKLLFWLTNLACIPTFILSILWSNNYSFYNILGGLGAVLQIFSLYYLYLIFKQLKLKNHFNSIIRIILFIVLVSYILKVIMQLISAFPYFVNLSLMLKPYFIIGYLHLFTLGFMSLFIIAIIILLKGFKIQLKVSKIGIIILLIGIILSEIVLFTQGFSIWFGFGLLPYYSHWLMLVSTFILIGLVVFLVSQRNIKVKISN